MSLYKINNGTCLNMKCYFGAVCKEITDQSVQCVCQNDCESIPLKSDLASQETFMICGSDVNTYTSHCQLSLYSCRMQKNLSILYESECTHSIFTNSKFQSNLNSQDNVTLGSLRRSTNLRDHDKFTRGINEPLLKSESTLPVITTSAPKKNFIKVPSFFGHSIIEMTRLSAYARLSIEIEFVSFTENGILLYNGQSLSGDGDFVSLSIKGGKFYFC